MRRAPMIDVKPWVLPLAVLGITAPVVVAFLAAGPFFGVLAAGLVAAILVLTAIRLATEPPRRRRRASRRGRIGERPPTAGRREADTSVGEATVVPLKPTRSRARRTGGRASSPGRRER
jgi:hypothetical protein